MAKKKSSAFKGDAANRFFSLGDIPKRRLTKSQKKNADDLSQLLKGGNKTTKKK